MRIKQIMLIAAMVLVGVAASAQKTVENDFCIVEAPEGWIVKQTQNAEEDVQSIVFRNTGKEGKVVSNCGTIICIHQKLNPKDAILSMIEDSVQKNKFLDGGTFGAMHESVFMGRKVKSVDYDNTKNGVLYKGNVCAYNENECTVICVGMYDSRTESALPQMWNSVKWKSFKRRNTLDEEEFNDVRKQTRYLNFHIKRALGVGALNVEVLDNPRCMVFAWRYLYVNEEYLSRGERAYLSGSGKNDIIDIVRSIVASQKSFSIDRWLNAGYQIRCQGYGKESGLIYDVVLPYDELRKKVRKYKSVSEEAQNFVYDMNLALKGDTVNADGGGLKCLELDEDAKCVIFKDKTIGLDSEHMLRDQRAYLIGKVRRKAKLLMDFFLQSAESPVKRLLNAGFSFKYQVYDENEVFVCDVVFQEEDFQKKQKSDVKEELAAYVHDMNSVLKVDGWKRDGDKLEYVKLDNDSACLVLGLNLSESDVADLRREGSGLPAEKLKKQYVKELAERINEGEIVWLKWCETDYPIKLLWRDKSGTVLCDAVVQLDDLADLADDIGFVFSIVDQMPSFLGGQEVLADYLYKNLKYPADAHDNGKQGRVLVHFVVNKDGSISDVEVAKSVYPSLDAETVRVVKAMPKWNSGKLHGKPVRVGLTLPVTFRLS